MTVESVKMAVVALEIDEVKIVRFLHTAGQTFGIILEATNEGYEKWVAEVETLGGTAELHNGQRIGTGGYPPSFLLDVVVYV